jgi:hypothetical protein
MPIDGPPAAIQGRYAGEPDVFGLLIWHAQEAGSSNYVIELDSKIWEYDLPRRRLVSRNTF